jgi:hypothetical protein
MRKVSLLLLLLVAAALPLRADRGQSYISYDDGGSLVKQAEDGREIGAKVNMPVFPGDEIITARTGRTELRLSDGNVVALDRSTAIRFRSILDSYDGDSSETVAELRFGQMMMHRRDDRTAAVRIDTANASYVAGDDTVYSLETDGKGKDRVSVFEGSLEVRTPSRTTRLRAGDEAHIDGDGLYGLVDLPRTGASAFERWFLRRADRYDRDTSRYLDSSVAYSDYDLESNGSWVFVSSYGSWAWRPNVAGSWRPYYAGYWHRSPGGVLVWVSDEPWGWVPYHYGRWGWEGNYGWVWFPGGGYAPAWVYWMYGSSYVGWAPAGWWDTYRPYYDWCYRPNQRAGFDMNLGFYGRIKVHDLDLRPWTFANPDVLISTRVDRASITTDAIRDRLMRDGNNATVSNAAARFSRSDLKDPSAAVGSIARRGIGSGTGKEGPGSPSGDMTSFFRRDPELSSTIRDRVVRSRGTDPGAGSGDRSATKGVGPSGPSGSSPSSEGRIGREGFRGADQPAVSGGEGRGSRNGSGSGSADTGGVIRRGGTDPGNSDTTSRTSRDSGSWRDRPSRPSNETPADTVGRGDSGSDRIDRPSNSDRPADGSSWRDRAAGRSREVGGSTSVPADNVDRGGDVPRRIIDRIGGARVVPGNGDSGSSDSSRSSSGGRHRASSSGSGSSSSSSGSSDSNSAPSRERASAPPPQQSAPAPPPPPPPPPPSRSEQPSRSHDDSRVQRERG